MIVRLVPALAVLLAACASGGPCTTDAQCGASAVCVSLRAEGDKGPEQRRCRRTCAGDSDCLLAGGQCRALSDRATGPATVETRDRVGIMNANRTTRGAIRICRGEKEVVH